MYGVRVDYVQELLRIQRMTPVPLAPRAVCGLINLRGQIVPALEARERLFLPARPAGAPSMNVVLRSSAGAVALVVDAIGDVIEADDNTFEAVPETVAARGKEFIVAACKLDGRLLLILDAVAISDVRDAGSSDGASSLGVPEKGH
jgi:purine-binding chemotaxis protein CheW